VTSQLLRKSKADIDQRSFFGETVGDPARYLQHLTPIDLWVFIGKLLDCHHQPTVTMKSQIFTLALAVKALGAAIPDEPSTKAIWQPAVDTKYQMILTGVVDPTAGSVQPADAPIYDIDLFYHPKSTIDWLHDQGKKVICYFSAGSAEDW
jgi:hypothetical protein